MEVSLDQKSIYNKLFDIIVKFKTGDGKILSEDLMKSSPENEKLLLEIRSKIENDFYATLELFVTDINNFFTTNLQQFQQGTQIHTDCSVLLESFMKELQMLQDQFIEMQDKMKDSTLIDDKEPNIQTEPELLKQDYEQILELTNYLMNYQDPNTKQFINEVFKVAPSRIQYPDYYDIIKDPIDLNTIVRKAKKHKYVDLNELTADLALIVKNAKTYNEPGSWIYKMAIQFKKLYTAKKIELMEETKSDFNTESSKTTDKRPMRRSLRSTETLTQTVEVSDDEGEPVEQGLLDASLMDGTSQSFDASDPTQTDHQLYLQIFEELRNLKDPNVPTDYLNMTVSGTPVKLSDPFYRLPSKYHYPDYYQEISQPIALTQIKPKIQKGIYTSLEEFLDDILLLFNNAMTYNIPDSKIYKDAQYFKQYVRSRVSQLKLTVSDAFWTRHDGIDAKLIADAHEIMQQASAKKKNSTFGSTGQQISIKREMTGDDDEYNVSDTSVTTKRTGRGRPPGSSNNNNCGNSVKRPKLNPRRTLTAIESMQPSEDDISQDTSTNQDNYYPVDERNINVSNSIEFDSTNYANNQNMLNSNSNSLVSQNQSANDQTALLNRLIDVFKDIVSLTDKTGYKIALYFIKKPANVLNFLDLTDIERGISEGKFPSVLKMIEEIAGIIQNYRNNVYLIANANPANPEHASLYKAHNACAIMLNFMNNNVKFATIIKEENMLALQKQSQSQLSDSNRLLRIRLQVIYNELINLQDRTTKKLLASPFLKLPSKTEYPDYYQIILKPIDLTSINCKIMYNNIAYQTYDEFFADLDLMLANAFIFNDPESILYKDALQLYQFVCEKRTEVCEEIEGKPNVQMRVKSIFTNIYVWLINHKDSQGNYYSDVLQDTMQSFTEKIHDLPPQYFPTYLHNNAMTFETIKRYLDAGNYTRLDTFQEHVLYCLKKALYYAIKQQQQSGIKQDFDDTSATKSVSKTNLPVYNAVIELIKRYFVLRERHCIRTIKTPYGTTPSGGASGGPSHQTKYFILRSYMAFDVNRVENTQQYLMQEFPNLLKNHIEQDVVASTKLKLETNIKNENFLNTSLLNATLDDDCGTTEETGSNSNDVNSSFGDWKKTGLDDTLEGYEVNGKMYYVGDFIYLEPSEKGIPDPHIMVVQQFTRDPVSNILYVQGVWFYRPYETFHPSTRKFYQQEVFKSDYQDKMFASKIIGKCMVLLYKDYIKYKVQDFDPKDVYICESRYFTKMKSFKRIKHWHHVSPATELHNPANARVTFIPRETSITVGKIMPSVFADKSYAQFLEENSTVPNFPIKPNQDEIPLEAGNDRQLQKVTWFNYGPDGRRATGMPITIGDYIEVQKLHSTLQPHIMLVQGIIKTTVALAGTSSNSSNSRSIYTIYGPRKFTYELTPFIPDGSSFAKNAKDLFLLPSPLSQTSSSATEISNNYEDSSRRFLELNYPDYITNDVETFTVTKKVYVLGAETFSKKWPTEIEEKDLYVCRYRLSLAINQSQNCYIIAPLIYENYCHEFPLPTPLELSLWNEWYHFDMNEVYEQSHHVSKQSTLSSSSISQPSHQYQSQNLSGSGLASNNFQQPNLSDPNNNNFGNNNTAAFQQHQNNSALSTLLAQKRDNLPQGQQFLNSGGAPALNKPAEGVDTARPSMAEVFFGSDSLDGENFAKNFTDQTVSHHQSAPANINFQASTANYNHNANNINNTHQQISILAHANQTSQGLYLVPTNTIALGGLPNNPNGSVVNITMMQGQISKNSMVTGNMMGMGSNNNFAMGSNQVTHPQANLPSNLNSANFQNQSHQQFQMNPSVPAHPIINSNLSVVKNKSAMATPPLLHNPNTTFKTSVSSTPQSTAKQYTLNERNLMIDAEDYKYIQKRAKPSGYIIYASERRQPLMDKHADLKFGEISKLIGTEWKLLSAEDKALYDQKAVKVGTEICSFLDDGEASGSSNTPNSSVIPQTPAGFDSVPGTPGPNDDRMARRLQKLIKRSHMIKQQKNVAAAAHMATFAPTPPPPSAVAFQSAGGIYPLSTFIHPAAMQQFNVNDNSVLNVNNSMNINNNTNFNNPTFGDAKYYLKTEFNSNNVPNYLNSQQVNMRSSHGSLRNSIPPMPTGIYACMWGDCDYQFEDLQDLIDHVTLQTDHVKARDGEYTCNWANCWKAKDRDPKPFLTQGRVIRHLRESHFKKAFIKNVAPEHISKNFMRSTRRPIPDSSQGTNATLSQQQQLSSSQMMEVDYTNDSSNQSLSIQGGGQPVNFNRETEQRQSTHMGQQACYNNNMTICQQKILMSSQPTQQYNNSNLIGGTQQQMNSNMMLIQQQNQQQLLKTSLNTNFLARKSLQGSTLAINQQTQPYMNKQFPQPQTNFNQIVSRVNHAAVSGSHVNQIPGGALNLQQQQYLMAAAQQQQQQKVPAPIIIPPLYINLPPPRPAPKEGLLEPAPTYIDPVTNVIRYAKPLFVAPPPSYAPTLKHSDTFVQYIERMNKIEKEGNAKLASGLPLVDDWNNDGAANKAKQEFTTFDLDANPTLKELISVPSIDDVSAYKALIRPEDPPEFAQLTEQENENAVKQAKVKALNLLRDSLFMDALRLDNWVSGSAA